MSFRGTTEQCLDALPTSDPTTIGEIIAFCGVTRSTAGRWLGGKKYPNAERLIRLWALLEVSGFEVEEFLNLPQLSRDLSRLIAFEVASPEEVMVALQSSAHSKSHLWRTLMGKHEPYPDNKESAKKFVESKREELDSARDRAKPLTAARRLTAAQTLTPSHTQTPLPEPTPQPTRTARGSSEEIDHIAILAKYLRITHPLVEMVESDSFDEADRKRLRKLVGVEEFFDLTNRLHRLGSNKAREIY